MADINYTQGVGGGGSCSELMDFYDHMDAFYDYGIKVIKSSIKLRALHVEFLKHFREVTKNPT